MMTPEAVHLDVLHEGEAKTKVNATVGFARSPSNKGDGSVTAAAKCDATHR
jgi:hypothetical protein